MRASTTFRSGSLRAAFSIVGAAFAAALAAQADERTDLAELNRLAREEGIDLGLSDWDVSGAVELGAGYNTNVQLSAFAPDASATVRAAADALVWRLPQHGVDYLAYFDATHTRYLSSDFKDATLVISKLETGWEPAADHRFTLGALGVYQDEIIDISSLDNGFDTVAPVELTLAALEPAWRWTPSKQWETTAKASLKRYDYRPPLDDYDEVEAEFTFAHRHKTLGKLTTTFVETNRDYEDRTQVTVGGGPIPFTHLRVRQTRGELKHELKGGERLRWRTRFKGSYLDNAENGEGYYDYFRRALDVQLSLESGPWRAEIETGLRAYRYRVQPSTFGIDPPKRRRDESRLFIRLERDVRYDLALFLEYERGRSDANDDVSFLDYHSALWLAGVRWNL